MTNKFCIIIVILIAVLLPTMYADSAFYLTKNGALNALLDPNKLLIWTISYGGLFELLLLSIIENKILYLLIYKITVIGINYIAFINFPKLERLGINSLTCLILFLSIHLYLSPSEYSLVVAGFSLVVISSVQNIRINNILILALGIIFLGFDLPNPKYIGLGLMLYISSRYIFLKENNLKITEIYVLLLGFLAVVISFIYIFLSSNIGSPPNYNVRNINGELLDLAFNRNYISALIPFKENKIFYSIYICSFIFLIVNTLLNLKNKKFPTYIVVLTGINFYFSLGILEPFGIVEYVANSNKMFSFVRTRAGYDLYLFFYLLLINTKYPFIKVTPIIESIYRTVFFIILIKYLLSNFTNLSSINNQADQIIFFETLNNTYTDGCYVSRSLGYNINPVFGFGPHFIKLSTNYKIFTPNSFINEKNLSCHVIITDIGISESIVDNSLYRFISDKNGYSIYTRK